MWKRSFLVALFACAFLTLTLANEEELEFEGSGEIGLSTVFPTDDEDGDSEGSGSGDLLLDVIEDDTTKIKTEPVLTDEEITEEPEVNPVETKKTLEIQAAPRDKEPVVIEEEVDLEIVIEEKDTTPEKTKDTVQEDDDDNSEGNDDDDVVVAEATSLLDSKHFLIAVIIGGCIGLLFTIGVIMLLVYRMRKKDEGSYALDDKNTNFEYTKGINKEYHV